MSTQIFESCPPNDVLQAMYKTRSVEDSKGRSFPLKYEIHAEHATALYQTILRFRPHLVVEIGMAHGASSLSILTALSEIDEDGRLISIDPHQASEFDGIGLENVRRSGFEGRHTLIEKPSYLALPQLLAEEKTIDFAYIDGWHTFDYTLLDFFYLDKMLSIDGVIGFNDCGYLSVRRVLKFVRTHRKYRELDVGLAKDFRSRNPMVSFVRRCLNWSREDRYLRKTDSWEPPWNFYCRF